MKGVLAPTLAALLLGPPVLGQVAAGTEPAGRPERPRDDAARDRLRERVEELLVTRMRQVLELADDQVAQVRPALREQELARRQHGKARRERMRALVELAGNPAATDAELKAGVKEIRDMDAAFHAEQKKRDEALLAILTPRQQARYLPLRERLAQELRRRLHEMRSERRPGERREHRRGPSGPPGGPSDAGSDVGAPDLMQP